MAVDTVLFVSKRASVVAATLLCLMAGRLLTASSPTAVAAPTEVRVAIAR